MRTRTAFKYVALPASAALLALTGCASSGSGGPSAASTGNSATPLKLVKAAYTTTTAAKSARYAIVFRVNSAKTQSATPTINGVEDFEHHSSDTTSTIPELGAMESRQIGRDVYVKMPSSALVGQLFKTTKPWMHTRISDSLPAAFASLFGGGGPDPTEYLKLLTSVSSSVTAVGTDDVRGQRSTQYRMTFDEAKIRKLDAQMGDCSDDEAASDASTPLYVWLDGQGRLTRLQVDISNSSSAGGAGAVPSSSASLSTQQNAGEAESMAFEFYDYGVPVNIQPPPADQTQTINDPLGNTPDPSASSDCTSSGSGSATPVPPTTNHS